jgi:WD40 repeat protein
MMPATCVFPNAALTRMRLRALRTDLRTHLRLTAAVVLLAAAGCSPVGDGPREGRIIHITSQSSTAALLEQDQALTSTAGSLCEKARAGDLGSVARPLRPGALPARSILYFGKESGPGAREWRPRFDLGYSQAESPQDARILACIEESKSGPQRYTRRDGQVADLEGYSIHWDVRILRWPDGGLLAATSFIGGEPPRLVMGTLHRQVSGEAPSREFEKWLSGGLQDRQTTFAAEGSVFDLAWTPDGKRLAIAGPDGVLALWDVPGRAIVRRFVGHKGNVLSVAFSPDGDRVASGGNDKLVRLWQVETGNEIRTLEGHSEVVISLAFSPDGERLASADAGGAGKFWDAATGRGLSQIGGGFLDRPVVELSFLPPDKGVVTRDCNGFVVRNAGAGRILRKLPGDRGRCLLDVATAADGHTATSVDDSGRIRIWDLDAATVKSTLIVDPAPDRPRTVQILASSPDGKVLAMGFDDGTVLIWSAALEKTVAVIPATAQPGGALRTWPCSWGKAELSSVNADAGAVGGLAFSPDARSLAFGSRTGLVRVVPIASGS